MLQNRITKVLIANRGEIACRIQRACQSLKIPCVTVVSEPDRNTYFARNAEELLVIGPGAAADSYLNIEKLLKAARDTNCNAVHPGYGFLAENHAFAQAVIDAGCIFIGPDPQSIRVLGSKTEARARVEQCGVPCTPGSAGELNDSALSEAANDIGYPVIIKAVGGGGGRGMRVVRHQQDLGKELPRARAEAKKNFGNDDVYLEKYIEQPRHVEVQVFGDAHGTVLHLGTRDCSLQRRHQKLVEEAPAPFLSSDQRSKIEQAAVLAAQSVQYKNAGTVEFLVSGEKFYFLEMNTRIQVEHPVTEMITGFDLVRWQIEVAEGKPLPVTQDEVTFQGHAIEFRIYAEDVENQFRPALGQLRRVSHLDLNDVREDFGLDTGDTISPFYDSLITKLVVLGVDRQSAIERSITALQQFEVVGLPSTTPFHRWVLENKTFRAGNIDIGFVERAFDFETLRAWRAGKVNDPKHQPPVRGAEVKNFYEYTSQKFKTTYTIEILHRKDGFFLAIPVDTEGRRARNKNCRMSNGLDTVMRSLIKDVLETTPPSEIFAEN